MKSYQQAFIEFALEHKAMLFGEFTLKSGRLSPYFFNAGQFNTGSAIAQLGQFYATAIQQSKIDFDRLFGPAYKGISLVVSTAIALATQNIDKPFCFNRKEKKNYGEVSTLVGAPLQGRVLIIDDVISAGLTIQESVEIIQAANATVAGIVLSMDRQERGLNQLCAVEEVRNKYHIPVICIISFQDIMQYLELNHMNEHLDKVRQYYVKYGA